MHSECNQNRGFFVYVMYRTQHAINVLFGFTQNFYSTNLKKKPTVSVVAVKVCAMTIVVYMYIECVC